VVLIRSIALVFWGVELKNTSSHRFNALLVSRLGAMRRLDILFSFLWPYGHGSPGSFNPNPSPTIHKLQPI
jgi:hypothetical protein